MITTAQTRQLHWLQSVLKIQPGEGARVALMILYSAAAMGIVVTIGYSVQDALFLSSLPTSDTPYLLILPAFTIGLSVLVYGRIAARIRLDHLVIGTACLLSILLLLVRVGLDTSFSKSFALLATSYVLIDMCVTLVLVQFWAFAGQVFNSREAKRLFGLIATGGTLVSMLAGLSLGPLSEWLGVPNLFFVIIGGLIVCGGCAWILGQWLYTPARVTETAQSHRSEDKPASLQADLAGIRRSRLLLAIAGFIGLMSVFIFVAIYQFSIALQLNFGSDDQGMVAFLGRFEFWINLIALLLQFFVISRVMKRFGLFAALLMLPIGMAIISIAGLLTGAAFLVMVSLRGGELVLRRTFTDSAVNILYLPIAARLRQRAIELAEVLYQICAAIIGLAILALQNVPGWSYLNWSWLIVIGVGLWFGLWLWTRPQYQTALASNLKKRKIDFENTTIDITDLATVKVLADTLRGSDAEYILHALSLITAAPNVNWDEYVAPLLSHPSPEVRVASLKQIGRENNTAYVDAVADLLKAEDEGVRAAAIVAYCAIARPNAIDRIAPFLSETQSQVRGAAVAGLIKYDGLAGRTQAELALDQMLHSPLPADRCEAARAIGLLTQLDANARLQMLLADHDRTVKIEAIRSIGNRQQRELLSQILQLLTDSHLAAAAAQALAEYGTTVESDLVALMIDLQIDRSVRARVPDILQHIGTPTAFQILTQQLHDPDELIRSAVDTALRRLRPEHPEWIVPVEWVNQALQIEIRYSYQFTMLRHDAQAESVDALLEDTLARRIQLSLDRIFLLLEMLYPNEKLEPIRRGLDANQEYTRAAAIELLDNLVEHHIGELLIPLIEAPVAEMVEMAQRRFTLQRWPLKHHLINLAEGQDRWLQACAIYQMGFTSAYELIEHVQAALKSDDPLLRETAIAAGRRLLDHQQYLQMLQEQSGNTDFPGVRRYALAQLEKLELL